MTNPLFIKTDNASQLVIGNSSGDSNDCAALVIDAPKGFLLPRLTQAQIDALRNIREGLQIYNMDEKIVQVYNGSEWTSGGTSGSGEPSLTSMTVIYNNAKT